MNRHFWQEVIAVISIIVVVVIGNIIYITTTNPNPILKRSALPLTGQVDPSRYLSGDNTIDPNDGYNKQALGVAAANQLIDGQVPYWNHFEGVGFPMLAEMQSAALFPLTVLLKLPAGFLIYQMTLEIVAGIGMLLLLRRLGVRLSSAVVGACTFALCSVFAWVANAVCNPVPFLPWLLFAVEGMFRFQGKKNRHKIDLVSGNIFTISLALSLYAGFPETAYLNGLFVAGWAILRFFQLRRQHRLYFSLSLIYGGLLGLLLAAPAIVTFVQSLSISFLGIHTVDLGGRAIGLIGFPMVFLPYVYGNIFSSSHPLMTGVWADIGGYIGVGMTLLALVGVFAKNVRLSTRIFLLGAIVIVVGRTYGLPIVTQLMGFLPGMKEAAVYRYFMPVAVAAAVILGCFGLDYIRASTLNRKSKRIFVVAVAILVVSCTTIIYQQRTIIMGTPDIRLMQLVSIGLGIGVGTSILGLVLIDNKKWKEQLYIAVCIATVFELVVLFIIPQFAAVKRPANVDTRPVQFLQANLEYQRFFTIAPIQPNYGSMFGIASINNNDLPVPTLWANYVRDDLNSGNGDPVNFTGTYLYDLKKSTPADEFIKNIQAYRNIGVKYIVTGPGVLTEHMIDEAGLVEVYNQNTVLIYEVSGVKPYFQVSGCSINEKSRDELVVSCPRATTLLRRELYYPGWQVTVNGEIKEIALSDKLFQQVALPSGESTVRFNYRPPNITLSWIAFGGASLCIVMTTAYVAVASRKLLRK